MAITIDELCERLRITQAIPEEEFRGRQAPYDLQAKWYDRKALPSTKAVAPIVSERLSSVETAVELGAGTGFRVLYYAFNNPHTQFLAIDNHRPATEILKGRIKRLHLRNIHVQTKDMYAVPDKYAAVIAIDCFGGQGHSKGAVELGVSHLRLARLVDTPLPHSFYCTSVYNSFNEATRKFMHSIFQEAGLKQMEAVPFEFVKGDGTPYSGNMLLAKP